MRDKQPEIHAHSHKIQRRERPVEKKREIISCTSKRDDPLFFLSIFQQFPFGTIGEERETGTLASGRFGTFSREGGRDGES
jgi:hypothetical protein